MSPPRARAWLGFAGLRLLFLAGLFLGASLLLFAAIQALPGDPVALHLKAPTPETVERLRAELGLDEPLVFQYARYAGGFLTGDWGESLRTGRPVLAEVAGRLPATLELAFSAMLGGLFIGVGAALLAEWLPRGPLERLPRALGAIGLTVPIFLLGLFFILAGRLWLGWFPASGRFDHQFSEPGITGFLLIDTLLAGRPGLFLVALEHLFLPALTLAFYPAALAAGILHGRLREPRLRVLLVGLRARGLGRRRIWLGHVLRLLGAPLVVALGSNFGILIGGAVLTETVFTWPGMGSYLVQGVLERDPFVVKHALLLVILLVFAVIYVSDLLALAVNPTARKEAGG